MKIIHNVNQKQKFHTNKNTGKNVDKQCRKCKSGSIFFGITLLVCMDFQYVIDMSKLQFLSGQKL